MAEPAVSTVAENIAASMPAITLTIGVFGGAILGFLASYVMFKIQTKHAESVRHDEAKQDAYARFKALLDNFWFKESKADISKVLEKAQIIQATINLIAPYPIAILAVEAQKTASELLIIDEEDIDKKEEVLANIQEKVHSFTTAARKDLRVEPD